ncbi:MAG TPA: hypothetical protein VFA74_16500 [Terriglobales bacterium]|nr:hypothetical protein [Terriglobales bacterium]
MTYEEIITGLRTLTPSDFDYNNISARGGERLSELTDALMAIPGGSSEAAIEELFSVMERMPDAELGSPGPLVHTLEKLKGYEQELIRSVRRCPTLLSVWMVNRILNTDLSSDVRQSYMLLLKEAATRSDLPKAIRDNAHHFVELQERRHRKSL